MQQLDLTQLQWLNAAELQHHKDGTVQPWRLPPSQMDFLDQRTRFQAGNPSGVRIRLVSDTRRIVMEVAPEQKNRRWFDLVVDSELVGRVELEPEETCVAFDDLPGGQKTLELWLNHMYTPVMVRQLAIDDGASWASASDEGKPKLLFYGSSISHGRQAAGPTESWPVGAARLVGAEPINLGLGGACILHPTVARFIRDAPVDLLSFCLGINVTSGRTHNERGFHAATVGFIQIVREKHPDTPLAIQSPIFCRPFEEENDKTTFSLKRCREILAEIVETFHAHGDTRIFYTDGLELLGADDEALLFDGIHPDAEGHPLMSQRYAQIVWPRLNAMAKPGRRS